MRGTYKLKAQEQNRNRVNPLPKTSMSCIDFYTEYKLGAPGLGGPGAALISNAHAVAQSDGSWQIKRVCLPGSQNIS